MHCYLPVNGRIKDTSSHCKCSTALHAKTEGMYFPLMFGTCPGTRACISPWRYTIHKATFPGLLTRTLLATTITAGKHYFCYKNTATKFYKLCAAARLPHWLPYIHVSYKAWYYDFIIQIFDFIAHLDAVHATYSTDMDSRMTCSKKFCLLLSVLLWVLSWYFVRYSLVLWWSLASLHMS